MTDHDPSAVEVLEAASLTSHMEERWDGAEIVLHTNALAAELALAALTAAGLAVVQVGEVPPWMIEGYCADACGSGWAEWGDGINRRIYVNREESDD